MAAKYVLAVVAAALLVMGVLHARRLGTSHPQARTRLLISVIFAAVSTWLFSQE